MLPFQPSGCHFGKETQFYSIVNRRDVHTPLSKNICQSNLRYSTHVSTSSLLRKGLHNFPTMLAVTVIIQ